jgi:hypothetical protein
VIFTGMPIAGDFAESNTCRQSLAAHTACTISVSFRPTGAGKPRGNLTLHDNAINSPQLVTLIGKGVRR